MNAYQTVTSNLSKLNRAELENVADLVAAMLAELEDAPEETAATGPATAGGPKGKGGKGSTWLELRTVNGCGPYVYKRWRGADGKKHSEYVGKAEAK